MNPSNEKPTDEDLLALCFEACRHVGVQIHATRDRERELAPESAFCRIDGVGHLYLSDQWDYEQKRRALFTALTQSGAADGFLPPTVREALEKWEEEAEI